MPCTIAEVPDYKAVTIRPVKEAAIHSRGISSLDAPSETKIELINPPCKAKPNWIRGQSSYSKFARTTIVVWFHLFDLV